MKFILILLLFPILACSLTNTSEETISPTKTISCFFATNLDNALLYHAPLTHPTQQKDTLQPNTPYPALKQNGEHYLVQFSETETGWIDRRAGGFSGECANVPIDTTSISDFDTICLFTASLDSPMFNEATLTNPRGSLPANESKVVIEKTDSAYLLFLDHASAAWVDASNGQISGTCDF